MAFGLGVLKLAPKEFWAMTPRELSAALAGALPHARRSAPMAREALRDLMRAYPDTF